MGDRANIAIVQHPGDKSRKPQFLYFYTHWAGTEMPEDLQTALKRGKERWDDEPYLARIIFCALLRGPKDLEETTGLAITTYITDNEYPLLVVDVEKQTVSAAPANAPTEPFKTVSFEQYCALDEKGLRQFRKTKSEIAEDNRDNEDD